MATEALLLQKNLTELDYLGRATSGNGEQQLFIFFIHGRFGTNSFCSNATEEVLGVKHSCDTLRVDSIVETLKSIL